MWDVDTSRRVAQRVGAPCGEGPHPVAQYLELERRAVTQAEAAVPHLPPLVGVFTSAGVAVSLAPLSMAVLSLSRFSPAPMYVVLVGAIWWGCTRRTAAAPSWVVGAVGGHFCTFSFNPSMVREFIFFIRYHQAHSGLEEKRMEPVFLSQYHPRLLRKRVCSSS